MAFALLSGEIARGEEPAKPSISGAVGRPHRDVRRAPRVGPKARPRAGSAKNEAAADDITRAGRLGGEMAAYDPGQRFPAGEYPNQHPGGDGLPAWTAADRPLEDTDLVLWHTFTAHHVVRPEDWPVMPVTTVGFQLRADGFFDGNPALDVPPEEHCHSG